MTIFDLRFANYEQLWKGKNMPKGTDSTGLVMKYFTLKPGGTGPYAEASRAAMRAYADAIVDANYYLHTDLLDWAARADREAEVAMAEAAAAEDKTDDA